MPIRRTNQPRDTAEEAAAADNTAARAFKDQQAGSNLLRTGTEFESEPSSFAPDTDFRVKRGTFSSNLGAFDTNTRRRSKIPPPPQDAAPTRSRLQDAARNLVTARGRNENRDVAGDKAALFSSGAGIAGLDANAVEQKGGSFKSVTDPASGFTVPNLGDEATKNAFDRFFANKRAGFQLESTKQETRNADPTRVAFQNRFFPSQTLKDAGV